MELLLVSRWFTDKSTIGELSVDGRSECFILEDVVREVPGQPVESWKIPGETAIPAGRYRVERTMSPRFKRLLPILVGVPGFAGVRIHPGNDASDTEGCLLTGARRGEDMVFDSRKEFDALDRQIAEALDAGEDVWIEIRRERE